VVEREALVPGEKLAKNLHTDPVKGLSFDQVEEIRKQYGWNELAEKPRPGILSMFLAQFKDFLVLLLLGAALIALLLNELTDAAVIMIVVVINAVLGVVQEYRAEKAMEALKTLTAPTAKVVREGKALEIPARELVPGDIVLLDAGDFVPADLRLLETANLQVNESALTGESVPVDKDARFQAPEPVPPAEAKHRAFNGTVVTFGRGKGVVTATGMQTEIGRIAGMLQEVEVERTPLQEKLARLGKQLGVLALVLCAVIFGLGVLRGNEVYQMFLTSVSLAVASIPEGLPAIVTIVLALGVQRMAARQAIIRKLPAVETLGASTVICSDKTGTLTQNAMTVRRLFCAGDLFEVSGEGYGPRGEFSREGLRVEPQETPYLSLLLTTGALCNDARLYTENGHTGVVGDPTEGALLAAASKAGLEKEALARQLPRIGEYPFDSQRKRMSTVHRGKLPVPGMEAEETWLVTKGAPDLLLQRCRSWLGKSGPEEIREEQRRRFLKIIGELSGQALRVLAFAVKPFSADSALSADEAEQELILVGFMGMIDPPRPEAIQAVEICRRASIKVKMITGDYKETALAVARELGLPVKEEGVLTGQELEAMDQATLEERVDSISVFARVSPEHKLRIVAALQARGEIVAMTGDGVNDAPALKKANIGISMGITGTAVAREASEMVLADDNFATIVGAVKEGRVIFENIKKAVHFLLTCNIGEILTILGAILLGWPLPLLPIQILWVNLVTDSLPALALGVDPPEKDIMDRPPRPPEEGIFGSGSFSALATFGPYIALITLAAFALGSRQSPAVGQTMAFATLALSQLVHVFNFRSLDKSVLGRELFANRSLTAAVLLSLPLQLVVLLHPFLQKVFRVVNLGREQWLIVVGLCLSILLFGEIWKLLRRFFRKPNEPSAA